MTILLQLETVTFEFSVVILCFDSVCKYKMDGHHILAFLVVCKGRSKIESEKKRVVAQVWVEW